MRPLEIEDGIELIDVALHLPKHRTLAVADAHLGFEEALHEDGALIPRGHLEQLFESLEKIFKALNISKAAPLERVIVNGDLRHGFGPLTAREWTEARELLRYLEAHAQEVVLVEGNHDGNVRYLAQQHERVRLHTDYRLDGLWFLHGDEEPSEIPEGVHTLIIGHEHPAVGLRDRVTGRVELYKCFLIGRYRGVRLIVQPALNPWTQGSDLLREQPLSPLLHEDELGEFDVYPVADDGTVYRFGPLKALLAAGSRR